jgi:hypothetical protein
MDKKILNKFLPYSSNVGARSIYRALERHFKSGLYCKQCTCYQQYGLMLVRGDYSSFNDHIADIANQSRTKVIEHFEWSLGQIKDSGLITIAKREERLYELVFTQLAPKEVLV